MRFVQIKEERQQQSLVIHCVQEMLMRQRTHLICAVRGRVAGLGVVGPERAHRIGHLTDIIENKDDPRVPAVGKRP